MPRLTAKNVFSVLAAAGWLAAASPALKAQTALDTSRPIPITVLTAPDFPFALQMTPDTGSAALMFKLSPQLSTTTVFLGGATHELIGIDLTSISSDPKNLTLRYGWEKSSIPIDMNHLGLGPLKLEFNASLNLHGDGEALLRGTIPFSVPPRALERD